MSIVEVILSIIIGTIFIVALIALLLASIWQAKRERLLLYQAQLKAARKKRSSAPREDWYEQTVAEISQRRAKK